ncbi:hypothetical protein [uncultured Campylobacter sp.]|nr:hypothetical protein [uncultured Campylobacter sp.]
MADITKFYLRGKDAKFIKFYFASEDDKLKFTRRDCLKFLT